MTGRDSLLSLRDRLVLMTDPRSEGRYLSPRDAEQVVALIDAARGITPWICRPSDIREDEVTALGVARVVFNKALDAFRGET